MQGQHLTTKVVERCRRIWWTIYVLDRQMTSLLGVPVTLRESDISAQFPEFAGSSDQVAIHNAHVSLSRVMALVVDSEFRSEEEKE